jgi:uncharacterized damage-inducible protein DinB
MPGGVPPFDDEARGLLSYLAQQRDALRIATFGLRDDQARLTPSASALSLAGLIKHNLHVERFWVDLVAGRLQSGTGEDYESNFVVGPDETLDGLLAEYADVAVETERVVTTLGDLSRPVPVPRGVPWFPDDVEAWSVRWVLLHLIEETARHAGHADIVRESIDGASFYPLMAAAEGWPASPWLEPWTAPIYA